MSQGLSSDTQIRSGALSEKISRIACVRRRVGERFLTFLSNFWWWNSVCKFVIFWSFCQYFSRFCQYFQRFYWLIVKFSGNEKVARALVELGANVNAEDNNKVTPLHKAAFNGNFYDLFTHKYKADLVSIFLNMPKIDAELLHLYFRVWPCHKVLVSIRIFIC